MIKEKEFYRKRYHPQRNFSRANVRLYSLIFDLDVKTIFEFGCGVGRHLERLSDWGYEVTGMDISGQCIRVAKKNGLKVFRGDEKKLKKFKKYIDFKEAIHKLKSHGIRVEGSFIFGFDSDDKTIFERTLKFTQDIKLDAATFHLLTPLPGTKLYEKLERENRIIKRDWSKYDFSTVVFEPKQMTMEELQEGIHWTMKEFYSLSSITRRLFPPPFQTLSHMIGYNLIRKSNLLKVHLKR